MKKLSLYFLSFVALISVSVSIPFALAQNAPVGGSISATGNAGSDHPPAPAAPAQQPGSSDGVSAIGEAGSNPSHAPAGPATIYRGPNYVNVTPYSSFGAVSITSIINNLITYISAILALLAVASLIYGGVLYMTAGGDSGRIGKAKQTVILTFVGIVLVSFAYMIVVFVTRIFYGS